MNCPTCGHETEPLPHFPPRLHLKISGKRKGVEIMDEEVLPIGNQSAKTTYYKFHAKGVKRIPLVIVKG